MSRFLYIISVIAQIKETRILKIIIITSTQLRCQSLANDIIFKHKSFCLKFTKQFYTSSFMGITQNIVFLVVLMTSISGQSSDPSWSSNLLVKAGIHQYIVNQANHQAVITYNSAIVNNTLKIPIVGIHTMQFTGMSSTQILLSLTPISWTKTSLNVLIMTDQVGTLRTFVISYLTVDNMFEPFFQMNLYTNEPNAPTYSERINITQTLGKTLDMRHDNALVSVLNTYQLATTDTYSLRLSTLIKNESFIQIQVSTESNLIIKKIAFSYLLFDKTGIQDLGTAHLKYGGISGQNDDTTTLYFMLKPIKSDNFVVGLKSFNLANELKFDFKVSIRQNNFDVAVGTSFNFYQFGFFSYRNKNCGTRYKYFHQKHENCVQNCSQIREYQDEVALMCKICAIDCYKCENNPYQCTACSVTEDFRTLKFPNSTRCDPIPGYYDTGLEKAQPCQSPCLSCENIATNCTTCDIRHFVDAHGNCQPCSSNLTDCQQCINSTVCIRCFSPFILNSVSQQCQNCTNPDCVLCSSDITVCQDCIATHYALGGNCVSCSFGIPNCLQCQNALVCLKCSIGYQIDSSTDQCIPLLCDDPNCSACPSNNAICQECYNEYFLDGQTCTQCNSVINGCSICADGTTCLQCEINFNFVNNFTCIQCNTGFIFEHNTKICVPCSHFLIGCLQCPSSFQCTKCSAEFYLQTSNKSCISCTNLTECRQCIDSNTCTLCNYKSYVDSTDTCQSCATVTPNCEDCSDQLTCISCSDNYYLDSSTVNPTCASCSVINGCSECQSSIECTLCIADTHYLKPPGTCELCTTLNNCVKCTDSNTCTECISNQYYLKNGNCQSCSTISHCLQCSSETSCTKCDVGYLINSNSSCQTCNIGSYLKTDNTCGDCTSIGINYCIECSNQSTCQKCAPGFVLKSSKDQCSKSCHSSCQTCFGTTSRECLTCDQNAGYKLNAKNQCKNILCLAKIPNCIQCNDANTCSLCDQPRNYFLKDLDPITCYPCVIHDCDICTSIDRCTIKTVNISGIVSKKDPLSNQLQIVLTLYPKKSYYPNIEWEKILKISNKKASFQRIQYLQKKPQITRTGSIQSSRRLQEDYSGYLNTIVSYSQDLTNQPLQLKFQSQTGDTVQFKAFHTEIVIETINNLNAEFYDSGTYEAAELASYFTYTSLALGLLVFVACFFYSNSLPLLQIFMTLQMMLISLTSLEDLQPVIGQLLNWKYFLGYNQLIIVPRQMLSQDTVMNRQIYVAGFQTSFWANFNIMFIVQTLFILALPIGVWLQRREKQYQIKRIVGKSIRKAVLIIIMFNFINIVYNIGLISIDYWTWFDYTTASIAIMVFFVQAIHLLIYFESYFGFRKSFNLKQNYFKTFFIVFILTRLAICICSSTFNQGGGRVPAIQKWTLTLVSLCIQGCFVLFMVILRPYKKISNNVFVIIAQSFLAAFLSVNFGVQNNKQIWDSTRGMWSWGQLLGALVNCLFMVAFLVYSFVQSWKQGQAEAKVIPQFSKNQIDENGIQKEKKTQINAGRLAVTFEDMENSEIPQFFYRHLRYAQGIKGRQLKSKHNNQKNGQTDDILTKPKSSISTLSESDLLIVSPVQSNKNLISKNLANSNSQRTKTNQRSNVREQDIISQFQSEIYAQDSNSDFLATPKPTKPLRKA